MIPELSKKRIGVLMGGLSKEREVSLKSGKAVYKALKEGGYTNAVEIDVGHDLAFKLKDSRVEVAFVALHGRYGEDGAVQGLLEYMRIPYTGSGILGCALSMNKVLTKRIFDRDGIRTPGYEVLARGIGEDEVMKIVRNKGFNFPFVIKPACEGSTIGLSVVSSKNALGEALQSAFELDSEALIEEFISGTEITQAILEGDALPLVEIAPKEGIFDYRAKYTKGMTDYYVPARVSKKAAKEAAELGTRAFDSLDCSSYARVDMIVDKYEKVFVLELNSIPGMTATSLVPMAAGEIGIDFLSLVERILKGASLKIGV